MDELSNDGVVLPAHLYLHTRKVAVPCDISLLGMDNTAEACAVGLTSYDFGMSAVADAMLAHIAGWSAVSPRTEPPGAEIPCVVMERTTSGLPGTRRSRT